MTKVWQFPDGRYLTAMGKLTTDVDQALPLDTEMKTKSDLPMSCYLKGKAVDCDSFLVMTGFEIMQSAIEEWNNDPEKMRWIDYWNSDLDTLVSDKRYKTDSEFSYFEEVEDEAD